MKHLAPDLFSWVSLLDEATEGATAAISFLVFADIESTSGSVALFLVCVCVYSVLQSNLSWLW